MTVSQEPSQFCAQRLKLLSDPSRLTVLTLLMDGPKYVGELNDVLQIEQSLLSHHLKVLRDGGFVDARREGKAVLYQLAATVQTTSNALHLGCCVLAFD